MKILYIIVHEYHTMLYFMTGRNEYHMTGITYITYLNE